jgi:hypothetical protein
VKKIAFPFWAGNNCFRNGGNRMVCLEVTIPIASEWPSSEELTKRNAVEAALNSTGVGSCTGAGGGMGMMHLTYQASHESAARTAIADAMKLHMPNAAYSVNCLENDL